MPSQKHQHADSFRPITSPPLMGGDCGEGDHLNTSRFAWTARDPLLSFECVNLTRPDSGLSLEDKNCLSYLLMVLKEENTLYFFSIDKLQNERRI